MNASRIIAAKRDGQLLSGGDVFSFVLGYARGEIPDYQMAALAMAIYLRGMSDDETVALTRAMLESGATLTWPDAASSRVDKHSTGGVGDKVSLVLAPILACCGLAVPMLSGRGLEMTGGTLDKLESIPGFRTALSRREICEITQRVGCVICGATRDIAPADRKLYALRDVTATVGSVPLITASILSKKLAEDLSALVLDVKFGSGAFMKTASEARQLAQSLVGTAQRLGVRTTAVLSEMSQPLGRMIGNAVEVNEARAALNDDSPPDLLALVKGLAAEVLMASGCVDSVQASDRIVAEHITSGRALQKFHEMVIAQGGDPRKELQIGPAHELMAEAMGYIEQIDAAAFGRAVVQMGGGRAVIEDAIDHSVGIESLVRVGDRVHVGQPLARLFGHEAAVRNARAILANAIVIGETPLAPSPTVAEVIRPG